MASGATGRSVGGQGARRLGVLSREVGCAGDGWSVDGGVVAVMVLGVEPVGKSVGAFGV